jgi:serine/threonine protein kinase
MDFIHKRRIVHRDIKLDNVLINEISEDNGQQFCVRIADFGLSCFIPPGDNVKMTEKCGTPCYVAPEVLRNEGYTTKCDIFSLGSVLFNLLTGRFLFKGANKVEVLQANKTCNIKSIYEYIKDLSKSCRDLLLKMLQPNPDKRPTA